MKKEILNKLSKMCTINSTLYMGAINGKIAFELSKKGFSYIILTNETARSEGTYRLDKPPLFLNDVEITSNENEIIPAVNSVVETSYAVEQHNIDVFDIIILYKKDISKIISLHKNSTNAKDRNLDVIHFDPKEHAIVSTNSYVLVKQKFNQPFDIPVTLKWEIVKAIKNFDVSNKENISISTDKDGNVVVFSVNEYYAESILTESVFFPDYAPVLEKINYKYFTKTDLKTIINSLVKAKVHDIHIRYDNALIFETKVGELAINAPEPDGDFDNITFLVQYLKSIPEGTVEWYRPEETNAASKFIVDDIIVYVMPYIIRYGND